MPNATELYFSSVLDKPVTTVAGKSLGVLRDLVMAPAEPLPVVTSLLIRNGKNFYLLPWDDVLLFNPVVISVRGSLDTMESYIPDSGVSLIRRDILDKQIVDVNGAKVVRVNDIKLLPREGLLCIFSVDVGFRGLLRRLGYEKFWRRFSDNIPQQEIGWHFVSNLEPNATNLTLSMAREQMADMHPADLADIIANIPRHNIQTVLNSLDLETAGEALHELQPELRTRIISQLDSDRASDILEEMPPDEAADLLSQLPEEKVQELLGLMDREEAEDISELMEHEHDTAGGLMTTEFLAISEELTMGAALETVRHLAEEIETIFYLYVLDQDEKLLGVVSLRELLICDPAMKVTTVMAEQLKTVSVDSGPEEIMAILAKYDLIAVPVLDEAEKMVGVVTIDDVVELFLPYELKRRRHLSR